MPCVGLRVPGNSPPKDPLTPQQNQGHFP
jgi:hypothetical protein